MNRIILKAEGVLVLMGSVTLYFCAYQGDWLLFFILFLFPDLSMMGYSINERIGKIAYNLGHTYISGILLFIGWLNHWDFVQQVGLIWIAHIAMDRMIGFGLKYDTFQDTHIHRL
ncbi:hypothetical protein J2Z48_001788 [Croceifilum oryzae]|uniref:DUF4260 domain-containing protein n=1 Tax=Croceifilum oryzae TaxID=1553429 RepID=A0AAJ1TMV3_9BACL|nr:DUF4260 domain-containing protein [Croceifilum oryzae]MDQ0417615.1 hypothetical protein [Croceifilum oryzae]